MPKGTVAIVGSPNVGKSTIFNRMIGERHAIVDDEAGITRDRLYGTCNWLGKSFSLIDTGGVEIKNAPFQTQIRAQVQIAIDEADVIVFITDVKLGVTSDDRAVAKMLYKINKPVILAVNKVDEVHLVAEAQDFYSLLESNDYIAILPYLWPSEDTDKALHELRDKMLCRTKRAILFGYGPRYLHSSGQLHKGDGNNGVFLILSAEPEKDIKIPGQNYTFGQLCNAQALGDFQALENKGRRAIKLHLKQPVAQAIKKLGDLF